MRVMFVALTLSFFDRKEKQTVIKIVKPALHATCFLGLSSMSQTAGFLNLECFSPNDLSFPNI